MSGISLRMINFRDIYKCSSLKYYIVYIVWYMYWMPIHERRRTFSTICTDNMAARMENGGTFIAANTSRCNLSTLSLTG